MTYRYTWTSNGFNWPREYLYDYFHVVKGIIVDVLETGMKVDVGSWSVILLNVYAAQEAGINAFELFDAISGEVSAFYEMFERYMKPELFTFDDFYTDVLILRKIEIVPEYRGQGLGLQAMQMKTKCFGQRAALVALKAFPLQYEAQPKNTQELKEQEAWFDTMRYDDYGSDDIERDTKKLQRYYARAGFKQLGDTAYMVSTNYVDDI
ncbi:MAG: hypothetical protein U9Q82_06025 [Chloroflexota bacterium]|nr:hypothetical protein [Chloroflexota bacterium]